MRNSSTSRTSTRWLAESSCTRNLGKASARIHAENRTLTHADRSSVLRPPLATSRGCKMNNLGKPWLPEVFQPKNFGRMGDKPYGFMERSAWTRVARVSAAPLRASALTL